MTTNRKLALFYAAYHRTPLGAPLGLTLTSPPFAEFAVLMDSVTTPDFESVVPRETWGVLCPGLSAPTGSNPCSAIPLAPAVRKLRPHLPIIFGGLYPTLMPDQTLIEPHVDTDVRAEGRLTFCELVEPIAGGHSWYGIRRSSFKHGADVHDQRGRPVANLNDLPVPPSAPPNLIDTSYGGFGQLASTCSTGCPCASNSSTGMVSVVC